MNQYQLDHGTWTRFGSLEYFNRVLYGGHAFDNGAGRFFTFAGDAPLFMGSSSDYQKDTWCYQSKNGVLMSGLALTPGHVEGNSRDLFSHWFHQCGDIVTRWEHGYMSYEITQFSAYFPTVRAKITIYPLNPDEGFLVQYDITTDQRIIWCGGFGGITPFFGRFEYHHSRQREFSPEDCIDNTAEVFGNYARIAGPLDVPMLVGDDFGAEYTLDAPEAMTEAHPSMFLTAHDGEKKIVKLRKVINANEHFKGTLVVLKNGTPERLQELLKPEVPAQLRCEIRKKYAAISFQTPDEALDMTVPDTLIALDASFHGNSFYHGAIGYHAPFLGWRGWYAPIQAGWFDRVKSAILAHFDTILHSDLPEKVWWDGADRPDLDHEGTQYHHLENTSGRMTALLHRDDIYDMQEVAIDMTLYYFDATRDLDTAAKIFDRLLEALDWQERILDPDGDGLYQNFLNTWISDGHCYNGAGCAQASCYNLQANYKAAALGHLLGRDVSKLKARAAKIEAALQKYLWLEKEGVLAESLDTIGSKLLHPSPELSTIYLAIECDAITPLQAARLLLWAKRHLRQTTTAGSRRGKLYYSSEWLPKKYSTFGVFPAENAALALALFKAGFADEAMEIVNALADAFELSPNPGSIQHVLADNGAADAGDIDFTDTSSCYVRMLIEGLWGIRFARLDNVITFAPQLPDAWRSASIATPEATLVLNRKPLEDALTVMCNAPEEKVIILPMRYGKVDSLFINGQEHDFEVIPGIGRGRIKVVTKLSGNIECRVFYIDCALPSLVRTTLNSFAGEHAQIETVNGEIGKIFAPCGVEVKGNILSSAQAGSYDLLIQAGDAILPLSFEVSEIAAPESKLPAGTEEFVTIPFNTALTEVHNQKFESPRPANYSIGVRLNGRYAWEWNHYGHNALHVDDSALRQANGTFVTASGARFATPATGNNALAVSIWDNFPTREEIPLAGKARRIHLFLAGSTNAMQSKVVNAKCTVSYTNGNETVLELVQPDNFDDFLIPSYQREAEVFYMSNGTHGLHLIMELNENAELAALQLEAVANEVILMLLGVTLER